MAGERTQCPSEPFLTPQKKHLRKRTPNIHSTDLFQKAKNKKPKEYEIQVSWNMSI